MAVKKVGERYRRNVCGNEVTVTKVGSGTLVCCGQNMRLISSKALRREMKWILSKRGR
jgi:desulfoferrodoxin-like iron-binding protein